MFLTHFVPSAPILYPLKASENVFWCFQCVMEECLRIGFKFKLLNQLRCKQSIFVNMTQKISLFSYYEIKVIMIIITTTTINNTIRRKSEVFTQDSVLSEPHKQNIRNAIIHNHFLPSSTKQFLGNLGYFNKDYIYCIKNI